MSYLDYVKLYAHNLFNGNNRGRIAKRGPKNNYWIHSLKKKDKLDVFDGQSGGDECWHIGTVIEIKHNDKFSELLIVCNLF